MAARLRSLRRGIYLYFRLLGQEMKSILAYRADFIVLLIAAVLVQLVGLAFIGIIFTRIPNIQGWTFWQVVMMYSLIFITEGVGSLFFEGTWWLSWLIYSGEFDQVMVRPVSPMVQVLASKVGFNGLGNIVTGSLLLVVSLTHVSVNWTPVGLLMVLILLVSGATIRVALNLGTAALSFWIKSPHSNVPMFVHQLGEFGKYPITIYSVGVQAVIVLVIPFAFVSFYPTAYVFDQANWALAGWLTPLVAIYCLVMAATLFRRGMRRYESSGN
jgi:ABC-2 type transport system permease protein